MTLKHLLLSAGVTREDLIQLSNLPAGLSEIAAHDHSRSGGRTWAYATKTHYGILVDLGECGGHRRWKRMQT